MMMLVDTAAAHPRSLPVPVGESMDSTWSTDRVGGFGSRVTALRRPNVRCESGKVARTIEDVGVGPIRKQLNEQEDDQLISAMQSFSSALGYDRFLVHSIDHKAARLNDSSEVILSNSHQWSECYKANRHKATESVLQQSSNCELEVWKPNQFSMKLGQLWGIKLCSELPGLGIGQGLTIYVAQHGVLTTLVNFAASLSSTNLNHIDRHMEVCAQFLATSTVGCLSEIRKRKRLLSIKLSQREVDCLQWAAHGKTNSEIGLILGISERTSIFHINNVIQKMGLSNRIQAVAMAIDLGLIHVAS